MSHGWERVAGVAKLLVAGDFSHSAGMGIVVEERYVVTCAHVVNSALVRPFEFPNEPDEEIPVAFPYSDAGEVRTGRVCSWHPMGPNRVSDVAVLELDD